MLLHYLAKHGNTKIASLSLKCCITAFPEFNQSLLDFFNFVDLKLILLLIQTLNLIINWVQLWPVGGYSSGEMKLRVFRSSCWTLLRTPCTGTCMSYVAERQIILLSTTRLITANFCWDSKISHHLTSENWIPYGLSHVIVCVIIRK